MQKLYKINIEGEEYHVGYPASVLVGQLEEELETLRAENEGLQIQVDHFKNLLLERAKERDALLAERDELRDHHTASMIEIGKMCGEDLTDEPRFKWAALAVARVMDELDKLKAEREAMMKQEPVATVSCDRLTSLTLPWSMHPVKLYAHPLPAQQIPEGWRLVPDAVNVDWSNVDHVNWVNLLIDKGWNLSASGIIQAVLSTAPTLSASQPKGDV